LKKSPGIVDTVRGILSTVASVAYSSLFYIATLFSTPAAAPRQQKKQRVESRSSTLEDENMRKIECAEACIICPNSERRNQTIDDNDRMKVLLLALELGWRKTKQGEDATLSQRVAAAAINQASAELGFLKPMVYPHMAHRNVSNWFDSSKANRLDVNKDTKRGRLSTDEKYGFERLRKLWRRAVKKNKDWASFRDLVHWILEDTAKDTVQVKLSVSALRSWFLDHKGQLKKKIAKPLLSDESKKRRVVWSTEFIRERKQRKYYCYLDEKWFYLESRREQRKLLPRQDGETEEEAEHEHVTTQNRRFPLKEMYIAVVGDPLLDIGFDGKVCLIPCVIEDSYKKKTTHCAFCDSIDDNNRLMLEWHTVLGPTATTMTPAAARDVLAENFNLRPAVKEKIVFVRVKKTKVNAAAGIAAKSRQLEYLGEGKQFGDLFHEYYIRVQNKKGDKLEKRENVDGEVMYKMLEEKIGPAMRVAYGTKKVPRDVPIYLQFDNAGGHGSKVMIESYKTMMKSKFNIICIFQSPQSPDFNALDRGVWMSLQAETAKLARPLRRDFSALHLCVENAWKALSVEKIRNICKSVETACAAALECDGGNERTEKKRTSKKEGVTCKADPYVYDVSAEDNSDDESDSDDEEEVGRWIYDVQGDIPTDEGGDDDDLDGLLNNEN